MLPRTPCKAFAVTGTKNTTVLKEITLRGTNAEFYYVSEKNSQGVIQEATLTRDHNVIIAADGLDFFTGCPASLAYRRLLSLPRGTKCHHYKDKYELPGGTQLNCEEVDAMIQAKAVEDAKPKPYDPFFPVNMLRKK
jgi:hypothetical protein